MKGHDGAAARAIETAMRVARCVPLPDVSRRLGHANVGVTASTYAHTLRKDDGHVAAAIEHALEGTG